MIEPIGQLKRLGLSSPICVAIHAVFAGDAYEQLLAAGTARVVSTDSIVHPSNAISIGGLLADASADLFSP